MNLLGSRPPLRKRLYKFWTTEVREDILLEAELLVLAFATGIGDATTYSEFRVFTANHTGNTILLAVGTTEYYSGHPPVNKIPIPLQLIGISLSMFILGGYIAGQLGNLIGCRQRWWLMLNGLFQTSLVFTASIIQACVLGWKSGPRSGDVVIDGVSLGVVALLAFSAGGQVAGARTLLMTEITTANATSTYVDLLIDERLFQAGNRGRNRRLCFLACLSAGSFAGGFTYERYGSAVTLFISALGKTIATSMLLFNQGDFYSLDSLFSRGGSIQTEEQNNSETTEASRTEKKDLSYGQSQGRGVLSDAAKYAGFEYRDTQLSSPGRRDQASRTTMGTILDLTDNHVYIQIPSWDIRPVTNVRRNNPRA